MLNNALKLYERIRSYLEVKNISQGDIAQVLNLPVRKFNYYLTEKSQVNLWPLLPLLLQNDQGISREWLYFGEGAMFAQQYVDQELQSHATPSLGQSPLPAAQAEHSPMSNSLSASIASSPLRLTGLTDCGEHGWFNISFRSVNVSPPRCGKHWVAVQAMGNSMVPHGILGGYTLFCDPSQPPATGEAVYAMRRDGTATVKVYTGRDAQGMIVLQGWQPVACGKAETRAKPGMAVGTDVNEMGGEMGCITIEQEPYYMHCSLADIVMLAPVIYIKCRL